MTYTIQKCFLYAETSHTGTQKPLFKNSFSDRQLLFIPDVRKVVFFLFFFACDEACSAAGRRIPLTTRERLWRNFKQCLETFHPIISFPSFRCVFLTWIIHISCWNTNAPLSPFTFLPRNMCCSASFPQQHSDPITFQCLFCTKCDNDCVHSFMRPLFLCVSVCLEHIWASAWRS